MSDTTFTVKLQQAAETMRKVGEGISYLGDSFEASAWREAFLQEWREFCTAHNLPVMLRNTINRASKTALKKRSNLQEYYDSYGRNPTGLFVYYQGWARNALQVHDGFHHPDSGELLTFEEWLLAVHEGKFPVMAIRQLGRKSKKLLLDAANKHYDRLTHTWTEYGYA